MKNQDIDRILTKVQEQIENHDFNASQLQGALSGRNYHLGASNELRALRDFIKTDVLNVEI